MLKRIFAHRIFCAYPSFQTHSLYLSKILDSPLWLYAACLDVGSSRVLRGRVGTELKTAHIRRQLQSVVRRPQHRASSAQVQV